MDVQQSTDGVDFSADRRPRRQHDELLGHRARRADDLPLSRHGARLGLPTPHRRRASATTGSARAAGRPQPDWPRKASSPTEIAAPGRTPRVASGASSSSNWSARPGRRSRRRRAMRPGSCWAGCPARPPTPCASGPTTRTALSDPSNAVAAQTATLLRPSVSTNEPIFEVGETLRTAVGLANPGIVRDGRRISSWASSPPEGPSRFSRRGRPGPGQRQRPHVVPADRHRRVPEHALSRRRSRTSSRTRGRGASRAAATCSSSSP